MANRKETEPESEPADVMVQASESVSQGHFCSFYMSMGDVWYATVINSNLL